MKAAAILLMEPTLKQQCTNTRCGLIVLSIETKHKKLLWLGNIGLSLFFFLLWKLLEMFLLQDLESFRQVWETLKVFFSWCYLRVKKGAPKVPVRWFKNLKTLDELSSSAFVLQRPFNPFPNILIGWMLSFPGHPSTSSTQLQEPWEVRAIISTTWIHMLNPCLVTIVILKFC